MVTKHQTKLFIQLCTDIPHHLIDDILLDFIKAEKTPEGNPKVFFKRLNRPLVIRKGFKPLWLKNN